MLVQVHIIHVVINNTMRLRIQSLRNEKKQPPPLNLKIKWILNHVATRTVAAPRLLLGRCYPRNRTRFPNSPRRSGCCPGAQRACRLPVGLPVCSPAQLNPEVPPTECLWLRIRRQIPVISRLRPRPCPVRPGKSRHEQFRGWTRTAEVRRRAPPSPSLSSFTPPARVPTPRRKIGTADSSLCRQVRRRKKSKFSLTVTMV